MLNMMRAEHRRVVPHRPLASALLSCCLLVVVLCNVVTTVSSFSSFSPGSAASLSRPARHLSFPLKSRHLSPFVVQLNSSANNVSSVGSASHSFHPTSDTGSLEGVATLSGCSNVDFSASVYVAGQGPFPLIVDTGSTTLAVVADTCGAGCDGVSPVLVTTGLTPVISNGEVSVKYADGSSWSGAGYSGQVGVGAPSEGGSTTAEMVYAAITVQSNFINFSECGVNQQPEDWHSGIIGFAYPSIASAGTDEWFARYQQATGIPNEFTLQLCVTPSGTSAGNLWLGAYDQSFISGQFSYISIVKQQHYNVYLTAIAVHSQSSGETTALPYGASTLGPCNDGTTDTNCAVIDSGTTFLALPTSVLNSLVDAITADSAYAEYVSSGGRDILTSNECFSTSSFASQSTLNAHLPTVSFTFADTSSGSNPVTITIAAIPGYMSPSYDSHGNAYYCSGLGSTGSAAAILGYSFMAQFTTRFDIGNSQIGFAPTAQCGVAAPPLPNFRWETQAWSGCSAGCGGGVQWRGVNCTDIFGAGHADIICSNGFAGPMPPTSQSCNPQPCSLVAGSEVVSVSSSSSRLMQGGQYVISYRYSGQPQYIALYLQPVNSSATTLPLYITRNASIANSSSSSSFAYTVPPSTPPGSYYLGGYASYAGNGYLSHTNVTVLACNSTNSVACGGDVCDVVSWCSGHGECDGSSGVGVCSCIAGYSNSSCQTPSPASTGCSLQCLNSGWVADSGCTCDCPSNFQGVICQYRYATMAGVFQLQPSSIDSLAPGDNAAVFALTLAIDVAFAIGLPASAVSVVSIIPSGSAGARSAVTFTVAVPWSNANLSTAIAALTSLLLPSDATASTFTTLSAGLASRWLLALSVVNMPPEDTQPTDDTGAAIQDTVLQHVDLIAGVGSGVFVALMICCALLTYVQRRELRKTFSHSAHRRKKSVLLREKMWVEEQA